MFIQIKPTRVISEIQPEFNSAFQFLKIEFFFGKPQLQNGYAANQLISGKKRIGDAQSAVAYGCIEINNITRVNELEKRFKDDFYLAAQVF